MVYDKFAFFWASNTGVKDSPTCPYHYSVPYFLVTHFVEEGTFPLKRFPKSVKAYLVRWESAVVFAHHPPRFVQTSAQSIGRYSRRTI